MELLKPALGLFFWALLAFMIVFLILKKFAWKPILNMLNERETGIANALQTAEKVKGEMSAMKAENEQLMKQAHEERSAMLKEAKEIKEKMITDAKDLAKTEANKIILDAQEQINRSKMAAITEVKNEIGLLSVAVAEKILRNQLSQDSAQDAYVKKLTEEIKMN